jgi:hypothetical protein
MLKVKKAQENFFLMVLGFELRASQLLGRCSTTWVMPPVWENSLWAVKVSKYGNTFPWEFQNWLLGINVYWRVLTILLIKDFFFSTGVWIQGLYLEPLH